MTERRKIIGNYKLILLLFVLFGSVQMKAQQSKELEESKWTSTTTCNSSLSFKTPYKLTYGSVDVPSGLVDQIEEINVHQKLDNPGLLISVQCVKYFDGYIADMKRVAQTTDKELEKIGGKDITFKTDAINFSTASGIKQVGWMTVSDVAYDFTNYIIHHESKLWYILIAHEQHDLYGYVMMDRIAKSLQFHLSN